MSMFRLLIVDDHPIVLTGLNLLLAGEPHFAICGEAASAPAACDAAERLQNLLQAWAIPQRRLTAPLYVWYGGQDPFIDAGWTKAAIGRACSLGGTVTAEFDPRGGHNPPAAQEMLDWMADRFAGKKVTNDC